MCYLFQKNNKHDNDNINFTILLGDGVSRLDAVLVFAGLFDFILASIGGAQQDSVTLRFVSTMRPGPTFYQEHD